MIACLISPTCLLHLSVSRFAPPLPPAHIAFLQKSNPPLPAPEGTLLSKSRTDTLASGHSPLQSRAQRSAEAHSSGRNVFVPSKTRPDTPHSSTDHDNEHYFTDYVEAKPTFGRQNAGQHRRCCFLRRGDRADADDACVGLSAIMHEARGVVVAAAWGK